MFSNIVKTSNNMNSTGMSPSTSCTSMNKSYCGTAEGTFWQRLTGQK